MVDEIKYRRIAAQLESEIRSGKYATRALPSEMQLVRRFGVGRKTVQRAMLELQYRGIVTRMHGKGTFLTERGANLTGLLGLLIPNAASQLFFQSFAREVARVGQEKGYTFLYGEAAAGDAESVALQTRRFAREFAARRVEGVIFRPILGARYTCVNEEVVDVFRKAGVPVVLVDSDIVAPPLRSGFDVVGINNVLAGRRIADYLMGIGRRRIAFLINDVPEGISVNLRNRLFGLSGAVSSAGARWSANHVIRLEPDDVNGFRRVFKRKFIPDAIVCVCDDVALKLMPTLTAIGKRVPEDVAVAGFDDIDGARLSVPSLTTIHQPIARIAECAFEALQYRMGRLEGMPPREILLDAPLIERDSTADHKVKRRNRKE